MQKVGFGRLSLPFSENPLPSQQHLFLLVPCGLTYNTRHSFCSEERNELYPDGATRSTYDARKDVWCTERWSAYSCSMNHTARIWSLYDGSGEVRRSIPSYTDSSRISWLSLTHMLRTPCQTRRRRLACLFPRPSPHGRNTDAWSRRQQVRTTTRHVLELKIHLELPLTLMNHAGE